MTMALPKVLHGPLNGASASCKDCEHAIACALVRSDESQCLRQAEMRMDRGLVLSWLVFIFLCIALAALFFL